MSYDTFLVGELVTQDTESGGPTVVHFITCTELRQFDLLEVSVYIPLFPRPFDAVVLLDDNYRTFHYVYRPQTI